MKKTPPDPDQRSPRETARLRDETIRQMIKMPPKAHKDESRKRPSPKGPTGRG